MQITAVFTLLALAAAPAHAVPNDVHERSYCMKDNCLKAALKVGNAAGSASCQSFLRKTVSLCPTTLTKTRTVTNTARTSTITKTATVGTTVSSTVSSIVLSTSTIVIPQTDTFTATDLEVTQVVVSETTTVATVTVTPTVAARKRAITSDALNMYRDRSGDALDARDYPTCKPTTVSARSVPKYASCCSATVKFSSACSCLGIRPSTTTLPRSTMIVTTTKTVQSKPTKTVTVSTTIPQTKLTTVVLTQEIDETSTSVTTASETETSTTTTVSTITTIQATATSTAAPFNDKGTFVLRIGGFPVYSTGSRLQVGTDGNRISPVYRDTDGYLRSQITPQLYISVDSENDGVLRFASNSVEERVVCSLGYPGINGGLVTCVQGQAGDQRDTFSQCGSLLYLSQGPKPDCTQVTVVAGKNGFS